MCEIANVDAYCSVKLLVKANFALLKIIGHRGAFSAPNRWKAIAQKGIKLHIYGLNIDIYFIILSVLYCLYTFMVIPK